MMRFLHALCLALLLPLSAMAQAVPVTSGEHEGFTRLVVNYGIARDWQIGRTTDGYELRLTNDTPVYDLTGVYDPIGRGRLASLWVDPESGALRIGIGCACHAQPFEFRPGIVVIDLKDGPPPKGSAFELALGGSSVPDLAPRPNPRPRARPAQQARTATPATGDYNWTSAYLDLVPAIPAGPTVEAIEHLPRTDPGLQPLRDVLLQQFSRGAAQGVVDMAHPDPASPALPEVDSVQVRMSDIPGLRIDKQAADHLALTAEGAQCVADDRLDIATWGTDKPVSEQMSDAMAGLMGEFDAPNPEAELRAIRFLLFIGFGAEAKQIVAQIATSQPDADVLTSLAHIIDESHDPHPAFAGMSACDTAAALWAMLSEPAPEPGIDVGRAAALRTFSALPVHLRRLLGPRLVDRFLALGDPSAAESARDAITRAPGDAGPEVALMEARIDLNKGHPDIADQRIEPLIASSGPSTPDALIAQVATHLAERVPLDPDQIIALEGLLHERGDSLDAARVAVALTQARALVGDFDQAFVDLDTTPEAAPDVWSLLAEVGPDSALLTHAIWPQGTTPKVPMQVAARLAKRLSDLGFSAQAGDWLQQVPAADTELAARIALQTKDAREALRLISGSDDAALMPIRSEALYQLADEVALAEIHAESGAENERWRAVGRARDWPQLAAAGPAPWQTVAKAALGKPPEASANPTAPGPLEQGKTLVEESAATRQHITDLLDAIAGPTASRS